MSKPYADRNDYEHVHSQGPYARWLIEQGWQPTRQGARHLADKWVNLQTNNGAHGGARPK